MTTADDFTHYDWNLDPPEGEQPETPEGQIWSLLGAYKRAADEESRARRALMAHLASLNLADPPRIGDLVTPWTLLGESDAARYPIIDIVRKDDNGQPLEEPGYIVRLSKSGRTPEISIYGPGGFFVAVRARSAAEETNDHQPT